MDDTVSTRVFYDIQILLSAESIYPYYIENPPFDMKLFSECLAKLYIHEVRITS